MDFSYFIIEGKGYASYYNSKNSKELINLTIF
jgi:hypothetical protein